MKKLLFLICLLFLSLTIPAHADRCTPGTQLTADGVGAEGAVDLCYIYIELDGTNTLTIVGIYDNATDASGTNMFLDNFDIPTNSITTTFILPFNPPLHFDKGIAFDFTCAGTFTVRPFYRK